MLVKCPYNFVFSPEERTYFGDTYSSGAIIQLSSASNVNLTRFGQVPWVRWNRELYYFRQSPTSYAARPINGTLGFECHRAPSSHLLYKYKGLCQSLLDTPTTHRRAMSEADVPTQDLERGSPSEPLYNSIIKDLSWQNVTVTVTHRKTKAPIKLLDDVNGEVKAGKR